MLKDRYGLPLGTSSGSGRDAYVSGCDCLLAAEDGAEAHLSAAVASDPGFALAHAALARARFVVGNVAEARKSAAEARRLAAGATERVQGHVDALCLAIEGKPVEALAATRAHLATFPRDAVAASPATGVFGLIGFSGRPGREAEMVEFLAPLEPHLGDDWWFQTVYAFALGETARHEAARSLIERSLAARPRSGHGAHVKAHILYEIGEDRAADDFLSAWMPAYPRTAPMHCHLSWHRAILAVALGRSDEAWRIYLAQVHPGGSWGPALNTATDSASFLWRAELAGHPRREELWPQVRDYALSQFPNSGLAFADLHRALACIAAGDRSGVGRILEELGARVAANRSPTGTVVPAMIAGLDAYERSDWSAVAAHLEPVLAESARIGGSRAQRDLLESTLLSAYLGSGRADAARALLSRRADRRPSVTVAGLAALSAAPA